VEVTANEPVWHKMTNNRLTQSN